MFEDPLSIFPRIATRLKTRWINATYPFANFGHRVSIHHSCEISRSGARYVYIGDDVYLGSNVWLNMVPSIDESNLKITLGNGCKLGRRSSISARNSISLEEDVLLAPSVLIMDHNHEYSNPDIPIHRQPATDGGRIKIGRNCWLGYGAVIHCGTKSFPPFSVVAGNPARLIKRYDAASARWVRVES